MRSFAVDGMTKMLPYFLICLCLPPLAWGEINNVRATVEISDARFCGNMGALDLTAKITFATDGADTVGIPRVLGIVGVLIARSGDDLARHVYELNYSLKDWGLLLLSGQPLDLDLYGLERGDSLSITRHVRVTIDNDENGQPRLASSPTHRLVIFLGMPVFYKENKNNAAKPTALYSVETEETELSTDKIKRADADCKLP
jgi:hypothetical protein